MNPVLNKGQYRGIPGWHCGVCAKFYESYWAATEHWHETHAPRQATPAEREIDVELYDGSGNRITHV